MKNSPIIYSLEYETIEGDILFFLLRQSAGFISYVLVYVLQLMWIDVILILVNMVQLVKTLRVMLGTNALAGLVTGESTVNSVSRLVNLPKFLF